jgi:prolipoprotein diacylglyceryl transferase
LFIIAGILAALVIGDRRWQARGGERGVIYDIALWAVPFGLIGGRLYHLATDWRTYFGEGGAGPWAALRIWDGGLGIWGAVALGGVGAWIACRRRGIPLPAFGDAIAPGIVLAQAIGRLGNYFNQELYGRETTMPWGLEIFWRQDASGARGPNLLDGISTGELYGKPVQPTFLYELLWNLLVFAALIYLDRRFTIGHGRLFALYVAGYCIGRFCIELLRDDAATHVAGIRINSFTSMFVFIGAVVYLILAPKGREDPATLSASAADRLVPDSVDEAITDSSEPGTVVATVADEPVGEPATTPTLSASAADRLVPDSVDEAITDSSEPDTVVATVADEPVGEPATTATPAETTGATAGDKPGVEAEAVAAEADGAEVEAPNAEAAKTPEQAASDEPEPQEAAAEEPDGDAAEAEPDGDAAEAEPEKAEAADVEAEPEKAEAAAAEAEPEKAEEEPAADAADVEAEADEPGAEAAGEAEEAESADDKVAVAEEPTGSNSTWWMWRLIRLNPRSRR